MTQKKFFQLASIAIASVWVFCITFAIAYTIKTRSNAKLPVSGNEAITTGVVITTTQATTVQTTTTPTTVPQLTTLNIDSLNNPSQATQPSQQDQSAVNPSQIITQVSTTQPTTAASLVPEGKENIIKAYVDGINTLKNTTDFSMSKVDTLDVAITDVEMTGGNALKNSVMDYANSIIAPPEPESYNFTNGKDAATGETPNSTIAPLNTSARVNSDAVTEATATKNDDGGYTIRLTLQPETQTMYTPAPNLSTMVETIDTSSLLPSGATMTDLNISYEPTAIKATFDSQNRIVAISHKLVSKGGGSGKMIISVKMTMEGTYTSDYTITYN